MKVYLASLPVEEVRRRKALFDNAWMLAIVFAVVSALVSWYFGLSQVDIEPVIWTMGTLTLVQFALNARAQRAASGESMLRLALASQLLGFSAMGLAWHLFGGLQQPIFPLFMMLPLFAGGLLLSFWQRQTALALLLALLLSGVCLTPDANSFIEERYGFSLGAARLLPAWLPRSRVAFADVTTTPAYDLMLTGTLAGLAVALNSLSAAIIALFAQSMERAQALHESFHKAQKATQDMVVHAPASEVLVMSATGRIVHASERFLRAFDLREPIDGRFLLDSVAFAYPAVVKRLMLKGGEEIQGASVRGREVVLRIRAALIGADPLQMARLILESCDDICWRGALDALEQPCFAINAHGDVVFLNRAAVGVFGSNAEFLPASALFDMGSKPVRWWDIAPLESARRMLDRGERRYLASIRRERVAESIGELCFVQLQVREGVHAFALS